MPLMVSAQDLIVLKDKSTISVRVVEEEKESVWYILQDDPEKKVKELPKDEFKKVKYEKRPASTNLIKIVHDSLVNEFYLNDIINQFIEAGYIIESFDNKYYTVSTNSVKKERFTAEIVENTANFRCFYFPQDTEDFPPNAAAGVVWGVKPEPGEKIGTSGSSTFKKLDAFCRSYLKNGKCVMEYKTDSNY
jgi:hypothetical protein